MEAQESLGLRWKINGQLVKAITIVYEVRINPESS
jgi:hypothetical protein